MTEPEIQLDDTDDEPQEEEIQIENKYKRRGARPIIICVILASGLGFQIAAWISSVIAGINLLSLSTQPFTPANQKIPNAVQGSLLIAFSTIATLLLVAGIVFLFVSWRRKFKRKIKQA